ncbi:MAG: hypothetical protein PHT79_11180 [Syntrophomonadaceae bacterium]|nr:hypothetical protein [Syntrophomonadaceae bacterium]MDD4550307.1 hypothetical protein [Syntrophomonadaceae bacterium]
MGCLTLIIFAIAAFISMYLFTISIPVGFVGTALVIAACFFIFSRVMNQGNKKGGVEKKKSINIKKLPFAPDKQYISLDHQSGIYFDKENRQIGFLLTNQGSSHDMEIQRYLFDDVWEGRLIIDEKTIRYVSRIESLDVSQQPADDSNNLTDDVDKDEVSSINLQIVVTDEWDQEYTIKFLNNTNSFGKAGPIDRESDEYKEAIATAQEWYKLMEMIIKPDNDTMVPEEPENE